MINDEIRGMKDWEHCEPFPADFVVSKDTFERQLTISGPVEGSFKAEVASFDNFLISQLTLKMEESTSCTCKGCGKTIGLYFNISGTCSFHQRNWVIASGQHTIYYSSDYVEQSLLSPDNGHVQSLEINLPVSYYTRLLSGYSELQEKFIAQIESNKQGQLHCEMLPMTMPMKWIINTIKQNPRTGLLKRLFLEAKILELLMLQVEQAEIRNDQLKEWTTRPSEQDALYEAKAILERSSDNPPTIKSLAKMVGTNEFNLKKGFKETFQETIYGFVSKVKMQQAKQMLLEGNRSIQEVASLSGYKNPQHFTVAFKKYFGVLPSKLK